MILTIDVGNTQTEAGLFADGECVLQCRRGTTAGTSSDELGVFFRAVLRENGFDYADVHGISCCSVVPELNYALSGACVKYFHKEPLFVQAGIKTGLKIKYANPKEVGSDRIADAVGAAGLYPDRDLVLVDMGTATTVEAVTKDHEYLGGAILPGLKMSVQALATGTAKLHSVEIVKAAKYCGTTTAESIQSGLFYGHLGAVRELIRGFTRTCFANRDAFIIGTGGFSGLFAETDLFDEIIPDLVLRGLYAAYCMNRKDK